MARPAGPARHGTVRGGGAGAGGSRAVGCGAGGGPAHRPHGRRGPEPVPLPRPPNCVNKMWVFVFVHAEFDGDVHKSVAP